MEHKGSNQSLVKVTNQNLILSEIRANSQLSRSELAKRLQLSNPSVSKHVDELLEKGLLIESGAQVTDVGRRPILLQFNNAHGCVAVIDLSSSNARLCVADLMGNKLEYSRVDGDSLITSEELNRIIYTLRDMLSHLGDRCGKLLGICVGVPGLVDPTTGLVLRSSRFSTDSEPANLPAILSAAFDVPVFVRNDINLAVSGEHIFGAGQEHSSLLLMHVNAANVGLGAVIGGQPYDGARGFACDTDSMLLPSLDRAGSMCPLSEMLCLDCLVSDVRAVIADGRETLLKEWISDPSDLVFDDVARAWGMSDVAVSTTVRRYARRIAVTCQFLTSLFDPELILLGGQAAKLGSTFVSEVNRMYEALPGCSTKFQLAKLSDSAVIFGGIELATSQAISRIIAQ